MRDDDLHREDAMLDLITNAQVLLGIGLCAGFGLGMAVGWWLWG
jgi:hypothetical protein